MTQPTPPPPLPTSRFEPAPVPVLVVVDAGYVGHEAVSDELGPAYAVDIAHGALEAIARVPSLDQPIVIVPEALDAVQGHKVLAELAALGHDFVGLLMIDDYAGVPRPSPGSGVAGVIRRQLTPGALAFHVGAAASVRADRRAVLNRGDVIRRDLDTLREGLRHELRGQLQTVVGLASLVLEIERPGRPPDDELIDWVGRIAAGGERMTLLVDHLCDWLHFSRRDLEPGVIDLSEVTLEAVAESRVAHPTRAGGVSTLPANLMSLKAHVRADGRAVSKAIRILIDNALRFDPAAAPEIVVSLTPGPAPVGGWIVAVKDRGPGLPEAALQRVFKLFDRHQHDPARPAGPGVGLAIVAKVAERHGGRAWLERNSDGPGLTAYLFLKPTV
ncbi:MAG: HAMP domain-containing sensor histidine kinase [Myxococcota bacterium]